MAKGDRISPLMIDEAFSSQDEKFLEMLRSFRDPKRLATLAERWARDHRPWARQQLITYLRAQLETPGHEPLVKRMFKSAEALRDDELMAEFMVRFDRLVRRRRQKRWRYDWQTRESFAEEVLYSPRNVLPKGANAPMLRRELFSYRTRYYLRRRAWRYFRRMGFQKPAEFATAVAQALQRYQDQHLASGENILDSWGLVHACFGRSAVLEFTPALARVRAGQRMADLKAEPMFPKLWAAPAALEPLLSLVEAGQARLVRVWAIELLRRSHRSALDRLAPDRIIGWLAHVDGQVQQFAADLFSTNQALGTLSVQRWLALLQTTNLQALEMIVAAMEKHVSPDRLSLAEAVEVACARPVPVARFGLRLLQARQIRTPDDRNTLALLSKARCDAAGGELARFAMHHLGIAETYDPDQIIRFFDSRLISMRQASWQWLTATSPGWNDSALWSKLIESPYDDVRLRLVEALRQRVAVPGADPTAHARLWISVLLGVHRGGRTKLTAIRQISDALRDHPDRAERLLPVLAVAIRSVRAPEARSGLAAIVGAVDARPELGPLVTRFLPELKLDLATAGAL